MKKAAWGCLIASCLTLSLSTAVSKSQSDIDRAPSRHQDFLVTTVEIGQYGGRLAISLRAEPKTFNPVTAIDVSSREIIGMMMADLIHINRRSQRTEAALANSWTVSSGGR